MLRRRRVTAALVVRDIFLVGVVFSLVYALVEAIGRALGAW